MLFEINIPFLASQSTTSGVEVVRMQGDIVVLSSLLAPSTPNRIHKVTVFQMKRKRNSTVICSYDNVFLHVKWSVMGYAIWSVMGYAICTLPSSAPFHLQNRSIKIRLADVSSLLSTGVERNPMFFTYFSAYSVDVVFSSK